MTRSAPTTSRSTARAELITVWIRPCQTRSMSRSRSTLRSTTVTSASMPAAICAAFAPAMPAPSTTTLAGATPDAPPISTPPPALRPLEERRTLLRGHPPRDLRHRREQAAAGRRASGPSRRRRASTFRSARNRVSRSSAARCRYVNSTWPSRNRSNSCGLRLLDLHDHLGLGEHRVGVRHDLGARDGEVARPRSRSPAPADASTTTRCPARTSSRTPSGVAATRYSLSLTSFGIPTSTRACLLVLSPPGARSTSAGVRSAQAYSTRLWNAPSASGSDGRPAAISSASGGLGVADPARPGGVDHALRTGSTPQLDAPARPAPMARLRCAPRTGARTRRSTRPSGRAAEELDRRVAVAGLLEELAARGAERVLALDVQEPGRDLGHRLADRGPELPHEQDVDRRGSAGSTAAAS